MSLSADFHSVWWRPSGLVLELDEAKSGAVAALWCCGLFFVVTAEPGLTSLHTELLWAVVLALTSLW